MTTLSNEEYLVLIHELLDQQYNQEEDIDLETTWIPADPPAKKRIAFKDNQGVIDLTNTKSNKIKELLNTGSNFKIDNFLLKVRRREIIVLQEVLLKLDIKVFEEVYKTPSGNPCRMTYPVYVDNDTRFEQLINLLNADNAFILRNNITVEEPELFVKVVRYLQVIKKLSAFI